MKTEDLLEEVLSLPLEKRAMLIDFLLESLNPPDAEIEKEWINIAKQRLKELRENRVKAVSGEAVFEKVWDRFSK